MVLVLLDLEYNQYLARVDREEYGRINYVLNSLVNPTVHAVGPENLTSHLKVYELKRKTSEASIEYFRICEQILSFVISHQVKKLYFCTHPVYPYILLHDLFNLGIEVFTLPSREHLNLLLGEFSHALEPMLLSQATEFMKPYTSVCSDSFIKLDLPFVAYEASTDTYSQSDYLIIPLSQSKKHIVFKGSIFNDADALIFTQRFPDEKKNYPHSFNRTQDISLLLYRPLIGGDCHFIISQKFYKNLSNDNKAMLLVYPDFVLYKNNAFVTATLLKTNITSVLPLIKNDSLDFELDYFYSSRLFYQEAIKANKEEF